jgi:LPS sulfotransferase NodH
MEARRPEAAMALMERARELLESEPATDSLRAEAAELLLGLGNPVAAAALVDGQTPSPPMRRVQRRACAEAAIVVCNGQVQRGSLPPSVAQRMARLPPFRAEEIKAASQQIAAIFDPIEMPAGPYPAANYANAYTICMTPRSGSTFLIKVMTEAGVFGRPHEYLQRHEPSALPTLAPRFHTPTLEAFLDALAANTQSPNGIFGLKADPDMLLPLLLDGTFEKTLRRGRFIYLTREDIPMQAISLARAQMTGAWSADTAPVTKPDFDFTHIYKNVQHLAEMMARWECFFAFHAITPLRLTYEEIDVDIGAVIARLAAHLNIPPPAIGSAARRIQRDEVSEDWRRRFHQTLASHKHP